MRNRLVLGVCLPALTTAVLVAAWPAAGFADTGAPRLGTAVKFAAVGGTAISNTGPSVITGDLGLSPDSAVTGFPPGNVIGTQHITDDVASRAQNDVGTAYTDAATAPTTSDLTGQDLGGKNLTPGVYSFSSSAQLTGPLTLSGNGVFIFQIGSALTTASNSTVLLTNGAQACAVYWQVGSSATLGSATQFQGNLMALTSITMVNGANILNGRALARTGALTLDSNRITAPTGPCTVTVSSSTGSTPTPTPTAGAGAGPSRGTPTAQPGGSRKGSSGSASSTAGSTVRPKVPSVGAGITDSVAVPIGVALVLVGGPLLAVSRRRSGGEVV